jgi:dephospho-CoA kinase
MILGLTGGLGCGKSTAARFLAELGFRVLDSDKIVREEVLVNPEVAAAIGARFPGVLDAAGRVARVRLAARVFAPGGEADLRWLEELVYPRVQACWRHALAGAPAARWVVEVPLLFEKKMEKWFDFTVCVAASSPLQLARLSERGLPPVLAGPRISQQLPLAKKIELADFVLCNDGTRDALRRQTVRLGALLADAPARV